MQMIPTIKTSNNIDIPMVGFGSFLATEGKGKQILLFESYKNTTVAVATLCYYMEPVIVILLSPLFF